MIRINLLPDAKRQAASVEAQTQIWLVAYAVSAVVLGIGLTAVYMVYTDRLEEAQRRNAALQTEIKAMEKKSERLEEVQAQLERSRQLAQLVVELNKARVGPTRVIRELARIVSPGDGPTIDPQKLEELRRHNPLAGYNRNWDTRRLWFTSLEEEERGCRIRGRGKTNEDVAEFLQRLALSEMFEDVMLRKTEATLDSATKISLIGFEVTAKVLY